MKKVFAVLLSILMVAVMGITSVAAPNNFVSSPSGNQNPEIFDSEILDENCEIRLVVTPYANRHNLDDESRQQLIDAYDIVINTSDISDLNNVLNSKANAMEIDTKYLHVSDLFDIDYNDCDMHNEHGTYKIQLKSDALDKFVGLLHFDGEDWTMIENAEIDSNGKLSFSTDKTGTFAIVLNTFEEGSDSGNKPQTDDNFRWYIYIALMAVSAVALVVIGYKLKKNDDK